MKKDKPIIEVHDLIARYGDQTILDGISFEVYPREIFIVLGSSGCGKTTLLKHLIGLLKPAAGRIFLWGDNIVTMDEEQLSTLLQRVGISFQSGALFNSMTVAENVELPMEEFWHTDEEMKRIQAEMKLSAVGLGQSGRLMPSELSGGMKKRVGFARAIAIDPEIVFFDEPSAGLDPIMAAGLDRLILELRRLLGITMVVVTHELESIKTIADRVLMLDRGEIIFLGTLEEVEKSSIPRVRQFFDRQPDKTIESRNP